MSELIEAMAKAMAARTDPADLRDGVWCSEAVRATWIERAHAAHQVMKDDTMWRSVFRPFPFLRGPIS